MAKAKEMRQQSRLAFKTTTRPVQSRQVQPTDTSALPSQDSNMSQLMDMTLGDCKDAYSADSPVSCAAVDEVARLRLDEAMANLSAFSTDELEQLAFLAQEEERRLTVRLSKRGAQSKTEDDAMQNVATRSPRRRSPRRSISPSKYYVEEDCLRPVTDVAQRVEKCFLNGADEGAVGSSGKSSSDLQGAGHDDNVLEGRSLKHVQPAAALERPLPTRKENLVKRTKSEASLRSTLARRSSQSMLKKKSPSFTKLNVQGTAKARPPQRSTSVRTGLAAEAPSSGRSKSVVRSVSTRSMAPPTPAYPVPAGYRLSSTGTLVGTTAPKSPLCSRTVNVQVGRTTDKSHAKDHIPRANPVPEWLKRRKEELASQEAIRLEQECERVRSESLGKQKEGERNRRSESDQTRRPPAMAAYTSAVDKRLAERAEWERRRKMRETILDRERQEARLRREQEEEIAYKLDRQRTVVHANPVPEWIYASQRK